MSQEDVDREAREAMEALKRKVEEEERINGGNQ